MDWAALIKGVIAVGLPELIKLLKVTTNPTQPSTPTPLPVPVAAVLGKPSEMVKTIQTILNQFMAAGLRVDGWLGPKTEAAFVAAIAKAKPILATFGIVL